MGRSLYPRVPDLLSPQTQNLTDGEIHYIIENGVQLTGMPAWSSPHQETEDDSWELVLFIRDLRPLNGDEKSQEIKTSEFGTLCRLAVLPKVPRGNLRTLAKNAHGKRRS